METTYCPCGSSISYTDCCGRYLEGVAFTPNAEALMRSRYVAYVLCKSSYLIQTTHPKKRYLHNQKDIEDWSLENKWLRLEIVEVSEKVVVFKAYFLDSTLQPQVHYERSRFEKIDGRWYYLEGEFL